MLLSNYDLSKNHGEFVHLNMLKDTLLKVGKIDTSIIASDVFEIDKVGLTKDNAMISYTTTGGQKKTYTVNFFNEYVKENEDTNRLVSQYFTYQNNEIIKVTLNYEDGQTKEINIVDEINNYIRSYFGAHITLNNNPVNSISFSDNSFSVNSENESKSYELGKINVPQIYSIRYFFNGVLKLNNDVNGNILKLGLNINQTNVSINQFKQVTTFNNVNHFLSKPFSNNKNSITISNEIYNENGLPKEEYSVKIGTIENGKIVLNSKDNENLDLYLSNEIYNNVEPSLRIEFKDETNNQSIDITKEDGLELIDNTMFQYNTSSHLLNISGTNHFIDVGFSIDRAGMDSAFIFLNVRFSEPIYPNVAK